MQTRSSIWRKPDDRTGREWGSLVRWLLTFLAVVGMAGALPLSAPGTAYACSCAFGQNGPRIVEQVSRSAAAFTGTATTERTDGYTAYYEFDVREVFGGDVGATTVVSSSTQSAACGRGFNLGTEYLVFTFRHEMPGNRASPVARSSNGPCPACCEKLKEVAGDGLVLASIHEAETNLLEYPYPRMVSNLDGA